MIIIIDYGSGNLRSIQKSIQRFYPNVIISRDLALIEKSKGLILPGVGAFGDAVKELEQYGLFYPLKDIIETIPTMGICLGMQLLFSNSEESLGVNGLDIIPGKVLKLDSYQSIRIPHTGWNRLIPSSKPYFYGYVYFNHSYYCDPDDKNYIISYVNHGISIPVIILKNHIIAAQFHPEKSQDAGDRIIKYFISLIKR
ncbi:MAG: imidazole glycerol phosphate synthase subunit HisH [Candidatus Odinarchaeota archaeon]